MTLPVAVVTGGAAGIGWDIALRLVQDGYRVVAADLVRMPNLGRIAEGYLADVIAVPGDPLADITVTQRVNFVMKGGKVFKDDANKD